MRNHILCLLASTLTLVGCSGSGGSTGTPDGAFEASIAAVQEVDFVKVLDIVLPAEGRAKLELDWEKQRKKPMSAEQAAETLGLRFEMRLVGSGEYPQFLASRCGLKRRS